MATSKNKPAKTPSKKGATKAAKKPTAKTSSTKKTATKAKKTSSTKSVTKKTAAQPKATQTSNISPNTLGKSVNGPFITFPTVCYRQEHSGSGIAKMNKELERIVLEQEKNAVNLTRSSIKGGYHSDRKFFEQKNWAVQQLKQLIIKNFSRYVKKFWEHESTAPLSSVGQFQVHMGGWSVLLREGDISVPHLHPRANVSGCYYVTVTDNNQSKTSHEGNLALCDPRIRACVAPIASQYPTIQIPPKEGALVMFPSYLEHYVLPFKGEGYRISIAFNIHFPKHMGGIATTAAEQGKEY